ncbi:unnamed protein product [marine sediment metagenome]|uniref:Uncharacterized protein n=1 Tax=marine sediment metagenome TaxID=412755 RepID=X1BA36_9ZZZZ
MPLTRIDKIITEVNIIQKKGGGMEVLNEQDLDWLTKAENRLARMRKREAFHIQGFSLVSEDLTGTILKIHSIRQWLQSRFELPVDKDINEYGP